MVKDQLVKRMSPPRQQTQRPKPSYATLSGRAAMPTVDSQGLAILQLNVEGLTTTKLNIIEHLAITNKVAAVLLQETHRDNPTTLKLPGYVLTGHTKSKHHGLATFVRADLIWSSVSQSHEGADVEWIVTRVQETNIVNVYKPPPSKLEVTTIPDLPAPTIYAGDFNCQHTEWGYSHSNIDGETLTEWASSTDAVLIYDPKEPPSSYSARWNSYTNPDLAFAKTNSYDRLPERRVLDRFPRSHHRPSLITVPSLIQPIESKPVKRWNFRKADWARFREATNIAADKLPPPDAKDLNASYEAYCNILIGAAKHHIPRGVRKRYLPCWDEECQQLLHAHKEAKTIEDAAAAATNLFSRLNEKRRQRWTETVESIDFTHSSRRAWQTINKLTGRTSEPTKCPITANSIATQLLKNGRFQHANKPFARSILREVQKLSRAPSADQDLSSAFTIKELNDAIKQLKAGKAPGHDKIHPEFIIQQGEKASKWLCSFLSTCLQRSSIPKTWRRASIIALPKPNKPKDDPKGYRPISLLCVPYKILERLIHLRLTPIIDPQLPREQAGFRPGKSTVDQVALLTQDIEDTFQAGEKGGVVLLDLTAAYDTVWHRGLHLKLLQTIPDRHMVNFIMELLTNRSFTLSTSDGQKSRLRMLKNGVPQGSVLAPMLFNIYIYDLPPTRAKKYGYADDLAILLRSTTWVAAEAGLCEDMKTLSSYLDRWQLKLSLSKTVTAMFHLNNREATRELDVLVKDTRLEFQTAPTYLGVKLDRTLTFRQHLENMKAKVTSRVALIRRLAGTTWGADAKTLRITTQSLVYSAAEYCAPVWSRSSHTTKLDTALNSAMRTISGCLKPTPVNQLPILSGIAPPSLRRDAAMLALSRKARKDPNHLLHDVVTVDPHPHQPRLKSRKPFHQAARHLLQSVPSDVSKTTWLKDSWKAQWQTAPPSRLHQFIDVPGRVKGQDLTRKQWITLNRLRTGVGRFNASMKTWGLADSAACVCGAPEQTVDHIVKECRTYRPPKGEFGLRELDEDMLRWLSSTELQV